MHVRVGDMTTAVCLNCKILLKYILEEGAVSEGLNMGLLPQLSQRNGRLWGRRTGALCPLILIQMT